MWIDGTDDLAWDCWSDATDTDAFPIRTTPQVSHHFVKKQRTNWSWLDILEICHGSYTQLDVHPSQKSINGKPRGKLEAPKEHPRRGFQTSRLKHEYSGRRY